MDHVVAYPSMRLLLHASASVNSRMANGFSALHEATMQGARTRLDVMQLVAEGAELDAQSADGEPAASSILQCCCVSRS